MAKPNKSTLQAGVLIAAVIVCAILARVFGNLGYAPAILGLIRTMLYIGLYMAWGVSVRKRVVQAQVRKCLTAVSVLTVFWFVVRSMKYYFVFDPGMTRYLWYQKAITEIKSRSLYDIGIEPQYKEQLLTLSTCFGDSKDSRMVVIGVEQIR